jgi:hypothetical protein
MFPKARQEKLTVRELASETLVYDHERNKAHCLNRAAVLVWRHCDGQTSLADLARMLHDRLHVCEAEAMVRLALEQLSRRHLLEEPVLPLTGPARLSRRDLLKQLAAAAVALPLVMTLTAPKARAQVSMTACLTKQEGDACIRGSNTAGSCCGGICKTLADFVLDRNNCGSCGRKCRPDEDCLNGVCFSRTPVV